MKEIQSWTEVPKFQSLQDEVTWWAEHSLDGQLMQGSIHEPNVRESTTITLRFDPRLLARVKRIARSRYLNYQSMIKQWLAERLEEESKK